MTEPPSGGFSFERILVIEGTPPVRSAAALPDNVLSAC